MWIANAAAPPLRHPQKISAAETKKFQSRTENFDAMALGAEINEGGLAEKTASNYQTKKISPRKSDASYLLSKRADDEI
jgi:hypothetical protein